MNDTQDVLDLVRSYAPTPASVAREWSLAQDDDVLARIRQDASDVDVVDLHFVPTRSMTRRARLSRLLPVAASAAVLLVGAAVLVAVLPDGGGTPPGGRVTGPVFDPPAGLSDQPDVGPHQIGYRAIKTYELDGAGNVSPADPQQFGNPNWQVWIRADGHAIRSSTACRWGDFTGPSFSEPTAAFFAALPTDVPSLTAYLRSHVQGSSSRDEAVFVAVGDALREADGLASPRLRAAMVAVLSRTPGVTLHRYAQDDLGRPALRVDFVDQRIRPNEIQSLYFDRTAYHLVEERDGQNGELPAYFGASPAYDGHGQYGRDPDQLPGPATYSVVTEQRVLDRLPANCR